MRVLLVANDPEVRAALGALIAARGHRVSAHATTDDALAAFAGADYPLIVLASSRPDDADLDFVRRLRSLPEGESLVVLAVVAGPHRKDLERLLAAGVDDVVVDLIERDLFSLRLALAERRIDQLTDRLHLLASRRADERLLRAIFDHSFDGLVLADDAGRLVEANAVARELLGIDPRAVDHRLPDLLTPGDPPRAAECWQILLHEGVQAGVLRRRLADGRERLVAYRLTANVVPGRHLGILRDEKAAIGAQVPH